MRLNRIAFPALLTLSLATAFGQQAQSLGTLVIDPPLGRQANIAVPDLHGNGAAQTVADTFNSTLFQILQDSAVFKMVSKSVYPLKVPQQPSELTPPSQPNGPSAGPWLTDWKNPPVNADYVTFGYLTVTDGRLELYGWLFNLSIPVNTAKDLPNAEALGKRYLGSLDAAGAKTVAQQFAADILGKFGFKTLAGTKIYFVSDRSASKEIWSMDYDGSNQQAVTHYRSICKTPAVSADGSKIAFTTWAKGQPTIFVHSTESGHKLVYYAQNASLSETPEFTPDGSQILFASTAGGGGFTNLFISGVDGSGLRRITTVRSIEVEPKVNPKTGRDVVFTSGRSGPPQIYRMNIDGAGIERLTSGEGEAVNPSWSPDGTKIAFAWTRGFEPGNYNIFLMDVASKNLTQLTFGAGRNENPTWAPDGLHLVFSSSRGGSMQIWTMLADGTQLKQLTAQGHNSQPVWSK